MTRPNSLTENQKRRFREAYARLPKRRNGKPRYGADELCRFYGISRITASRIINDGKRS